MRKRKHPANPPIEIAGIGGMLARYLVGESG